MRFRIIETITRYRIAHGWSEYQLSEKSGVPQSTISSWYRNGSEPSISSLEKVCKAFDITLAQFFAEKEEFMVITPEIKGMLQLWNALTAEQKQLVLNVMKHLKKES